MHSNTLGATLCRHNVVVGGISSDPPRQSDGGCFIQGGGGFPVDQVSVGRVCTIVNGAVVIWLEKNALHSGICWVCDGDINHKVSIFDTCGQKKTQYAI